MRVLFSTTAGAGHFGPMLPFARACRAAGHDVVVVAPAAFASAVERAGFVHRAVDDADPAEVGAVFARVPQLTMQQADELVVGEVFGRINPKTALPAMRAIVRDWRPDVVVRETAELASYVAAMESRLPHVHVAIATSAYCAAASLLADESLRSFGVTDGAAGVVHEPTWTLLPDSYDETAGGAAPPTRYRADEEPRPARTLPDWWVGSTDPFVYVSFGTVAAGMGLYPLVYRAVVDALADAPVRVLMTVGSEADPAVLGPLPGNVHVEQFWPQADVMATAAAVVGHGGFGTTMLALAAGVPQVVLPLFSGDQHVNAGRVAAAGVGVNLAPADAHTLPATAPFTESPKAAAALPAALERVLEEETFATRAAEVAAEIAALPSASQVTDVLESLRR
jgi:UDP:flavonoid glycosyltransferase YjiC (YdhE family)